jgi:hypothetical protein
MEAHTVGLLPARFSVARASNLGKPTSAKMPVHGCQPDGRRRGLRPWYDFELRWRNLGSVRRLHAFHNGRGVYVLLFLLEPTIAMSSAARSTATSFSSERAIRPCSHCSVTLHAQTPAPPRARLSIRSDDTFGHCRGGCIV